MKKNFPTIIVFVLFSALVFGNNNENPSVYQNGEKLTYLAHFGILNAGKASFTLKEAPMGSDSIIHAVARAWTIGLADKIFEVEDIYESYFNIHNGLPIKAIRNISEGKYRYYNEVEFFHSENIVVSQKSGKQDVPSNILDMVSSFYYLRNSLKDGVSVKDTINFQTYFADEIFPLKLRFHGVEKIHTKLGYFECLKFVPVVEPGRIFDSEDDVTIWISNDRNFVPVKVRIDLIIGSIKCDLIEYSGLKTPLRPLK